MRSRLDEIEDYNFTVKCLIRKRQTEIETRSLLLKRGLTIVESDELINLVMEKYNGIRFFEASKISRYISSIIDFAVVVSMIILIHSFISPNNKMNTIEQWLLIIFVALSYFVIIEYYLGASIGRFISGNRIVVENYLKPNPFQLFIRTINFIIPSSWINKFLLNGLSETYVVSNKTILKESKSEGF